MSLDLITKSHGVVNSGFYKAFMKLSLLGKYAFETKDLCNLAQSLAENPKLKRAKIFAYNEDKFWQLEKEYNYKFFLMRMNSISSDSEEQIRKFIRENSELSAEEKIALMEDKAEVPVKISKLKEVVKIGEYEIGNPHFASMMAYILHGGFNGWREVPDFAKSASDAVEASKNPLYKSRNYIYFTSK